MEIKNLKWQLILIILWRMGLLMTMLSLFYRLSDHPFSKIQIHKAQIALSDSALIKAYPSVLGLQGEDTEWTTMNILSPNPSLGDWVGVFSPAMFNSSACIDEADTKEQKPKICTAPIKVSHPLLFVPRHGLRRRSKPLRPDAFNYDVRLSRIVGRVLERRRIWHGLRE